jgi:precorrin-2 dehydrogenase / sirohydrochlorin ferrochelatase
MACLELTGRRALVVGAGPVGLEKTLGLLAAGADVVVVAPHAVEEVAELAGDGSVAWERRPYRSSDLDGCSLVVAATSDRSLNESVSGDAEERNMLVNVADVLDLCNFILPAVHRDGPLAVAISTAGASPALAKRMKREAAMNWSPAYARLAEILEGLRPWAKANLHNYRARRDFFEAIVNGRPDPIQLLEDGAEAELHRSIAARKAAALHDGARRVPIDV